MSQSRRRAAGGSIGDALLAAYSEAVASIQAYPAPSPGQQGDILNFLRVRLVHNQPGSL